MTSGADGNQNREPKKPQSIDLLSVEMTALLKDRLIDLLRVEPEGAEWRSWWKEVIALSAAAAVTQNLEELVMVGLEL